MVLIFCFSLRLQFVGFFLLLEQTLRIEDTFKHIVSFEPKTKPSFIHSILLKSYASDTIPGAEDTTVKKIRPSVLPLFLL